MEQGYSKPFLCKAENGDEYIVKGLQSTRESQISEWICGNLAKALDLPIADFSLVEIPEALWEELPPPLAGIGPGIAFGSKKVTGVNWLEQFNAEDISPDLQRNIIIFDLWIKNMDRNIGNPNLLYQAKNKQLVIIDHNSAFDQHFDPCTFLDTHIFRNAFPYICDDMMNMAEFEQSLHAALAYFDDICDNLPPSWLWMNLEEDIPSNYDFEFARTTLERLNQPGELWRTK